VNLRFDFTMALLGNSLAGQSTIEKAPMENHRGLFEIILAARFLRPDAFGRDDRSEKRRAPCGMITTEPLEIILAAIPIENIGTSARNASA
jgi:hypothetical protein